MIGIIIQQSSYLSIVLFQFDAYAFGKMQIKNSQSWILKFVCVHNLQARDM